MDPVPVYPYNCSIRKLKLCIFIMKDPVNMNLVEDTAAPCLRDEPEAQSVQLLE